MEAAGRPPGTEHMNAAADKHTHDHDLPAIAATSRAFAVGVALNLAFVAIEAGFGLWANSLALLADAGHNFIDVIGLTGAWVALLIARRLPSARFTYGLRGSTILAALANAMALLVTVGAIVWEALRRLTDPPPPNEMLMIWVALVGVLVNAGTALLLRHGRKHDINLRGAFLHMLADALVSVGVVLAGLAILWAGWLWLDPAVSLAIAVVIFIGTWGLLKEALRLSLHAVPAHIDPLAVKAYLQGLPGVREVHDLHIWGMSTTETALTAHLVVAGRHPGDGFLARVAETLQHDFRIGHTTLQIELADGEGACRLAPDHVV